MLLNICKKVQPCLQMDREPVIAFHQGVLEDFEVGLMVFRGRYEGQNRFSPTE